MTERKDQAASNALSDIKQYVCRIMPLTVEEKEALKSRIKYSLAEEMDNR